MRIALFGRNLDEAAIEVWRQLLEVLRRESIDCAIEEHLQARLIEQGVPEAQQAGKFVSREQLLAFGPNFLISLGGDGTLLETLAYVKNTVIPVFGINLGRLGFLSNVPREKVTEAIRALQNGHFRLEKRSVLELKSENELFQPDNYALNDFTIHKRDTGSMISVETFINGEYLTTYWADGVIVSTPTGSSAYSLSCGGPVMFPDSSTFVLTPVAPHNLTIRPIVLSDRAIISFRVKGRGSNHLVSLDSRFQIIEYSQEIAIQRAPFFFNLVKLNDQNFIDTLRQKLSWGLDTRNL